MSATTTSTVMIRLVEQLYGVPVNAVREIIRVPRVTSVPRRAAFIRGLINLRGTVMPLLDLRTLLGMRTLRDELDALQVNLEVRENDHKKWLAELEASVRERREFRLTTDPHACAFGQWYDSYIQEEMPLALRMTLSKFDSPHQALHGLGVTVTRTVLQGDVAKALQLIDCNRNTCLASMLGLFAEARALLQEWSDEVAVIIDSPAGPIATAADAVEGIDRIHFKSVSETMHDQHLSTLVDGVGSVNGSDRLVTLLRVEGILRHGKPSPT